MLEWMPDISLTMINIISIYYIVIVSIYYVLTCTRSCAKCFTYNCMKKDLLFYRWR